jgi:CheY-like chemotaxis protein
VSKKKILIIDDDQDISEGIKTVLESKPYEVHSASSGVEGVEAAKKLKPDMVILDVMMETKDSGFNVARKLKKDPALAKIPILMLTAIREKTGFDFSKEAGDEAWLPVDDYVEKPIHSETLLEKVAKFLD